MQLSPKGLNLLKQFEGCKLKAYQDQKKIWTIGYGTTHINDKPITKGQTITQQEADKYLLEYIELDEMRITHDLPDLTQNQFDAIICLIYNIGYSAFIHSKLFKAIKNNTAIDYNWLSWNHVNKQVNKGLTNRRNAELKLFKGIE